MSKSDLSAGRIASLLWRYGVAVLCVAICTVVTFPLQGFGVRTSLYVALPVWSEETKLAALSVDH
jgi:hypothetical protein